MTGITALWLPILLAAVIVFAASSIIHMLSPWHKSDYRALPKEDEIMAALRPFAIRRSGDSTRKMIASPETLLAALNSLSRTANFQLLPSSLKNEG